MNDSAWHWARLDREGVALVQETEGALGADIVLAYGAGGPVADASTLAGLAPAPLTESQLDCLRGVESKLGIIAVAWWVAICLAVHALRLVQAAWARRRAPLRSWLAA